MLAGGMTGEKARKIDQALIEGIGGDGVELGVGFAAIHCVNGKRIRFMAQFMGPSSGPGRPTI